MPHSSLCVSLSARLSDTQNENRALHRLVEDLEHQNWMLACQKSRMGMWVMGVWLVVVVLNVCE